jgi:uncharacterized protein (DUF1330 family)
VVGLTQQELARMIGVSRSWVAIALSEFERLGLISKSRGKIVIRNAKRLDGFMSVFSKFKGKLLVADAHPVVQEGKWPRDKVVIMEFPDDAAAKEFQDSPEYQEISVDRKAGADAIVLTVRGLR